MIEAGSRVNWSALESGVADKIYFYYAPKILGGTQSLPVAGGAGRRPPQGRDPVSRREAASDRRTSSPWKPGSTSPSRRTVTGIIEELGTSSLGRHPLVIECQTVLSRRDRNRASP